MESKEKIAASIVRFNRRLSESIENIERTISDLEQYKEPFADQRNLLVRIELLKRIFTAAINHAENLPPRHYMIEESPEEFEKQREARKALKATRSNTRKNTKPITQKAPVK